MSEGVPQRRTKIVCTIGPATSSREQIRALITAGMNVARLNFSHGVREEHGRVVEDVRAVAGELGVPVAILQDLAGPKVRVGAFATGAVMLVPGASFTLTTRAVPGDDRQVSVSYPRLSEEVKAGDSLLLADGTLELDVERVEAEDIHCRVVVGGPLSARKGVNVPSGLFGLPILGEKDVADLRFGLACGVDYVGLSFVRTAGDVLTARREIAAAGKDTPIIAKIETQAALANIDAILAEADGIMIARGDLSIETPYARVPVVQKTLIAQANRRAKPVITATQMLFSMVISPNPTRAEVADVANAVMDGSDAVMLSDETTVGKHPTRAVEIMAAIAATTEAGAMEAAVPAGATDALPSTIWARGTAWPAGSGGVEATIEAFAVAACDLAARLDARVIVTLTTLGRTARYVAKFRPRQPILAGTTRPETYRRLALVRGVEPMLLAPGARTHDDMIGRATAMARSRGFAGAPAVFVSNDTIRGGTL
jgi:pyruvate kinase